MANEGPGPGEVLQFAGEVKKYYIKPTKKKDGIQKALAWVFSENDPHPVTGKSVKGFPDMKTIAEAARAAEEAKKDVSSLLGPDYFTGVWECLAWIVGTAPKPPKLPIQHW